MSQNNWPKHNLLIRENITDDITTILVRFFCLLIKLFYLQIHAIIINNILYIYRNQNLFLA